jgi:Flp pilus assembly protein CpaB
MRIGTLASFAVVVAAAYTLVSGKVEATGEPQTVEVLIATRDLMIGERITEPHKLFSKTKIRKGDAPQDAITALARLDGRILKRQVQKGKPITEADLFIACGRGFPADDELAIGLRIAAKHLPMEAKKLAGKQVDVLWFQRGEDNTTDRTDVLFKDVLILDAVAPGSGGTNSILTVALTPQNIIKMNMAKETGLLQIVVPERVELLVAQRDLAGGQKLTDPARFFAKKLMRKDEAPKDPILTLDALQDRVLKSALRKDDVILQQHMLPPAPRCKLSSRPK